MNEERTKNTVKMMLQKTGGKRDPYIMRQIVLRLAESFGVSVDTVKTRLIMMGYPEVQGVLVSLGDQEIPDHGCRGPWEEGITYTIAPHEAFEMMRDPTFREAIESGQYTYVEGHFCLNRFEYVHTYRGEKKLSAYARWNIDECCLAFRTVVEPVPVKYDKTHAQKRKPVNGVYETHHVLAADPGSAARNTENLRFAEDAIRWCEIARSMKSPKDLIMELIRKKGLTTEVVSARLGISQPVFSRWLSRDISLRHVIAVCLALDLRADISLKLVNLAGYSLNQPTKENSIFLSLLFESYHIPLSRANEILVSNGLAPLTNGQQEMEAV